MQSAARSFSPLAPRSPGLPRLAEAAPSLWLASAARAWHAEPDEDAVARSVARSVAVLLPAGAEATVTRLGPGRRPLPAPESHHIGDDGPFTNARKGATSVQRDP